MAQLKKWELLQNKASDILESFDGPAKVTTGSGSVKGNGDVISASIMVECKQRTRKNIIIEQNHWDKICEEAELLDRIPAIVSENQNGTTIISMDIDDFAELIDIQKKKHYHKSKK